MNYHGLVSISRHRTEVRLHLHQLRRLPPAPLHPDLEAHDILATHVKDPGSVNERQPRAAILDRVNVLDCLDTAVLVTNRHLHRAHLNGV